VADEDAEGRFGATPTLNAFRIVLAFTVCIAVAAPAETALASERRSTLPSAERPDVIIILTDDQRWDTLEEMPTVASAIASNGVVFSNAFVVNPLCCPSRASLLTGLYSHSTGVYRQIPPYGRLEWFDGSSTLATWMDAAGYTTGFFGKYLDGGQSQWLRGYVPPGWDRFEAFVKSAYYDYKLTVDGVIRPYGSAPPDYSTDVLAKESARFLQEADAPAFMMFAPAAPHEPGIPAPRHASRPVPPRQEPPSFDEADTSDKPRWLRSLPPLSDDGRRDVAELRVAQLRSLLAVDEAVANLIEIQRDRGRLADTLFVFTSDNGLLWGEHRWTKKEVPYEESIRVPLAVRYDALAVPHVEERLALNIDIAPTIARLAGISAPEMEGRDLTPLLRAKQTRWRSDFLVEHLEGANPVPTYCAVRTERALYVEYRTGEHELYDLRRDPFQLRNLAGRLPRVEEQLRARLDALCEPPPPSLEPAAGPRGTRSRFWSAGVVASAAAVLLAATMALRFARREKVPAPEGPVTDRPPDDV
jgi:N-acetylglucosamine-6-sulfatase